MTDILIWAESNIAHWVPVIVGNAYLVGLITFYWIDSYGWGKRNITEVILITVLGFWVALPLLLLFLLTLYPIRWAVTIWDTLRIDLFYKIWVTGSFNNLPEGAEGRCVESIEKLEGRKDIKSRLSLYRLKKIAKLNGFKNTHA